MKYCTCLINVFEQNIYNSNDLFHKGSAQMLKYFLRALHFNESM